jgi:osmoprotectant transport system permease protein
MTELFSFVKEYSLPLLHKTMEHISLTIFALIAALCIAIPLGIWIAHSSFLRNMVLKVGSISQTIPSLAMLAFLVPFVGLGVVPTLIALTFYAIYPILRGTYTGINSVPVECIEAADGLGFSYYNKLFLVELPLAMPVIISSLRVAGAMTIGITTIAAFIGAGGLGDFIVQGLSLNDSRLILLGSIPAALLALVYDYGVSEIEIQLQHRGQKRSLVARAFLIIVSFITVFALGGLFIKEFSATDKETITIGSKNFTEQNILAEIMAQLIEQKTNLKVMRKLNLGTTSIVHEALVRGDIDIYPEYSGVAYVTILKKQMKEKNYDIFADVKDDYKKNYDLVWLPPFGFSNSQSLAVKRDFAKSHNLNTMSDLAFISQDLQIATPPDFLKRPDGLPGLERAYGFKFKKIIQVDPNLMYVAIKNNNVDVIAAFTTDGRLEKYDLVTLKDDHGLYPPYDAAAVIRARVLESYPEIQEALKPLFGNISDDVMRSLNYKVEVEGLPFTEVALQFVAELKSGNDVAFDGSKKRAK